jgi:two-component system nitrogen regulation sensor histidine kinase NtrY
MATANSIDVSPPAGLMGALRAVSRSSLLAVAVGVLAVASSLVTYGAVSGVLPRNSVPGGLGGLLLLNLTLVVLLGALIGWRLVKLWSERRLGMAGARLHVRLVAMFSAIAVVPAILVAVFAAVTLNLGMEQWFSGHVKTAVDNAVNVAHLYFNEYVQGIKLDALLVANGIERDPQLLDSEHHISVPLMFKKLQLMTEDKRLLATYLFDSHGNLLGSVLPESSKLRTLADPTPPTPSDIATANQGLVVIDAHNKNIVRALVHLQALNDAYLMVVRRVDPKVFGYYTNTLTTADEYEQMETNRSRVQLSFTAFSAVITLLILMAAIWLGLWAANRLVRPISGLIRAAERVSEGDLKAQVTVERDDDEIGTLGLAFNRMTSQLDSQRGALMAAHRQNDERRHFTETVLAGVSAGVIGLDADGTITIVNRAAARLLNATPEELEDRHYAEAVPELAALIRRAIGEPVGHAGGEVTVKRGGTTRSLSVQVASEQSTGRGGFVATFDDITDLVSAQRTAAWADVARRIAHEIKNPLTPIQLSAERLKRKYASEVKTDPEVFAQCTDTIIRQVGDIGRMVDEFSSFARMPTPVMRKEIAQELLQQGVFLQRIAHPQITFETSAPKDPVRFECDGRLVSQALTNVLKNAGEGIAARHATGDDIAGRIRVAIETTDGKIQFRITDNGIGLPPEHRHRLTEPYVTTRVKGTGLGLAIVRKIMEDHGGDIALGDAGDEQQGAEVTLTFPLRQKTTREKGNGDEQERIGARSV